ncbi:prophage Lp2 protein 53 [Lactiplantibacillus plantarum]|uniref:collagen-like protein n=1 Tax=Lactiplantibacillus plantarum TaxID=1590 RepID=UPI0007BBCCB2|nr:collagen-like protein [Lactiplantibacillus plantarum]KZT95180.1 prophage Lp2 protein 53 [Lactiplantibacillus plantarum]KZT97863.1 prophage Lp2 protein 53 [Lactiplantibacillus plantarum]
MAKKEEPKTEKTLSFTDTSSQTVKIGDTTTSFTLVCGNDNTAVDLTHATSITVKLGNDSGYLKSIKIDPNKLADSWTGKITVKFSAELINSLPAGSYAIEVWVADSIGTSIYPSDGSTGFTITNNIQSANGATITTITFDDFVEAMNKAASTIAKGDKGDKGDTPDLSNYTTVTDLNNGLSTKVTDNKNGTEQLNGVQVQPFNKLSDTIGGRNLVRSLGDVLVTPVGAAGWSNTTIGTVTPEFFKITNQGTTHPITISFEISTQDDPTKTNIFDRIKLDGVTWGNDNVVGTDYFSVLGFKWLEMGNNVWKGTYALQFGKSSDAVDSNRLGINLMQTKSNTTPHNFTVLGNSLCLYWGTQAIDWTPAPEDKVNVSDMRKPASDVAGIEEVNAKQDKIGYTPADDSAVLHLSTGNTAARPTGISTGYQYFDTSLNKPIWYTGKNWVDATGTTV